MCYLALFKADRLAADIKRNAVLISRSKNSRNALFTVYGRIESDLDIPSETSLDMLLGLDLALDAGRGDLKMICLLNGIYLIKDGIDRSVYLLAVIDRNAFLGIDRDAQIPLGALFDKLNVPKHVTKLFYCRNKPFGHDLYDVFSGTLHLCKKLLFKNQRVGKNPLSYFTISYYSIVYHNMQKNASLFLNIFFLFYLYHYIRIRKAHYHIAKIVPLGKLVIAAGIIDADKIFIIERYRAHLIIA